ncbi:VOC family protein [Mangrovimicrobium sediminis]|uniref:VOC family protein n=1 Tax=Mangrovimicrobium sediminis TaxID=2562682 RepID=A0A4Z0LU48_9GAMM|nr:VOC family protein [Haliea sp. SAOS-164]TGD70616.1 VOC family protein [Haliea sp. SAOS-164]
MFSHVMVGSDNVELSKVFYDKLLDVLGYREGIIDEKGRCFYIAKSGVFAISKPIDGRSMTHANGGTIGFIADSPSKVDEWHAVGIANGGSECEEPPGIRENVFGRLYVAYLRDPYGNKICALHRVNE